MQTEAELSTALQRKIQGLLLGGDDPASLKRSYVSFANPGIAVEPTDFDFGFLSPTGAAGTAAADFASLVNSIPPATGTFVPSSQTLPDIYAELMRDKQLPT